MCPFTLYITGKTDCVVKVISAGSYLRINVIQSNMTSHQSLLRTHIISIWNQCLQAFLGKLFGVPCCTLGLPCGSAGKESACNAGDLSLIPGLGRSPGEGKSYPLQYSGLENSMDCIVHGVAKSQAWLLYIESRCCTLFQHYRQERSMTSRKRKEKFAHICSYRCETWFKWTSDF